MYRVVADAVVSISAAQLTTTERTRLDATTRIVVQQETATSATLTMTITPIALTRDGRRADLPAEQSVSLEVARDGRISGVTPREGTGALDAAQIEDLVPLIGPPLPAGRVHLTDRWTRAIPSSTGSGTGVQDARLAAVRIVGGYDCGIVALSTRRPVVREREIAGTMLRLEGVEYAAGEMAFAFREGFPVSMRSRSEARLAVSGGPAAGGGVVVRTNSSLRLVRRTGGG